MGVTGTGLEIGYFELADERIEKYRFCNIKNKKIYKSKIGEDSDGITLDEYDINQPVLFRFFGFSKITCGANISSGDLIASDSDGCAIKAENNHVILGKALEDGVKGQVIEISLQKYLAKKIG